MGDHVLFFYGTLMAPQVLYRVIYGSANPEPWQKAMLSFQPAILHGYRRHRVLDAEYPGIVRVTRMEKGNEASSDDRNSVIGTLVSGLTDGDLDRLDIFEGLAYERQKVVVCKMRKSQEGLEGSNQGENQLRDMLDAAARGDIVHEGGYAWAETYVWVSGEDRLEDEEWDFEAFKRDKLKCWAATEDEC